MLQTILININRVESRVAVLEDGVVTEIYIERQTRLGLLGNIYLGKVVRVLPGMQAAFVDIGQERTGFLHVNDMLAHPQDIPDDRQPTSPPLIQSLLTQGQQIAVQISKDQLGSKGPRLTTKLSIPSRFLVYLPDSQHIGVSNRIDDEVEQERLKTIISKGLSQKGLQGGIIVRTAAEGATQAKIMADLQYLNQRWLHLQERIRHLSARSHDIPPLIYQDLALPLRALRDLTCEDTDQVVTDNLDVHQQLVDFAQEFVPIAQNKISYHNKDIALFDAYQIEAHLQMALKRRVNLQSGGYIIIDQTEAMTTIDVNTGSFVKGRTLEDIVYQTNLEAAHIIAWQIRLRNLGGIIILDFIDMVEESHRTTLMETLTELLNKDPAKTNITQVSTLGLVEMTRKRNRPSLGQTLCEPCPTCMGNGYIKTAETMCYEIFRELLRYARRYPNATQFTVVAHITVIDRLLSSQADTLSNLEFSMDKSVNFQVEALYTQAQYDILHD